MSAEAVVAAIRATPWLEKALAAVRDMGPRDAWIGAGAVRNAVWDALAGSHREPGDIDVVHFDARAAAGSDAEHRVRLVLGLDAYRWEVTNQATVHEWHRRQGRALPPYESLEGALAGWPETATAVAARMDARGQISLLAPLGLDDLVHGVVRPNPRCPDLGAYRARLAEKRWLERWPHLRVIDDG